MTCSKCECLVRVKNKLGYNLYYCGYKKYGVLKALSGLYIDNEEYRKNNKTCKYYKGENKGRKEMTAEEKSKYIDQANKYWFENRTLIERYSANDEVTVKNAYIDGLTEGRKELEKENAELKEVLKNNTDTASVTQLMELIQIREENAGLKQILYKLVNAFNDYECAGPEQEQENTWEILRDLMHKELFSIQNGN